MFYPHLDNFFLLGVEEEPDGTEDFSDGSDDSDYSLGDDSEQLLDDEYVMEDDDAMFDKFVENDVVEDAGSFNHSLYLSQRVQQDTDVVGLYDEGFVSKGEDGLNRFPKYNVKT